MRKFAVSVVVSMFVASGLLVSTPAAQAAEPYPGTILTNCKVNAKDRKQGQKGKVKALVNVPGSKVKPKGPIKVIVKRVGGGFRQKFTKNTRGRLEKFKTNKLKRKGTYRVKLKYRPGANSVFVKCTEKTIFRVR